jgi:hypothetical protein
VSNGAKIEPVFQTRDRVMAEVKEGYVYCMTNEHMPGFVKVGYTDRTPEDRLAEANGDTWSIPCWVCEASVKVRSAKDAEKAIHLLLSHDGGRISSRREFFTCSVDYVKMVFNILRTQNPEPTPQAKILAEVHAVITNELRKSVSFCEEQASSPSSSSTGIRESRKIFRDGQLLKHVYKGDEAIAVYKKEADVFVWRTVEYASLARLNSAHKQAVNPELKNAGNAWDEWTCIDTTGNYVPVKNLPEL